jgi:predicted metalloendopeptidase
VPEKTEAEVYEVGQMVKTIMSEYKAAIQEADWPTEETKKNLLKKGRYDLRSFKFKKFKKLKE